MRLTDDQLRFFETQGYLVVENVLGDDVLAPVRAEYDALLDRMMDGWGMAREGDFAEKVVSAYEAGHDWFQPMDISLPGDRIEADTPMHIGPAVFDMITAPALLDMVEDLIGPELTSNPIQHVRIKPPERKLLTGEIRAHVGGTDWHQDRAVALEEADQTRMVTVWLAVTDATVENGCLQVVPGRADLLPHCPQRQTSIAKGFVDTDLAVPLPVKAGGAVIFHPMTPHASLANVSDSIRWSFDLRYNVTGDPTGRGHFPEFVARSRQTPASELRDWREWKRMWDDARARLAAAPHIDLHRWSADAPVCA
ncbi:phytanoyl-CoA dioxygenase [Silicimonas algicola]|uniref:Ectoine hydroxylase-related dioxygenase (Phytanoyl-CoA dioxygenase family) n=1 Tax=Silicimonas algicola TaxID=1826607 RepID=A0A316G3D4_9RHOB|nr:phytanoyl-CoA dioxygenase family protein [Silicimonas algicola]AZQ67028.1 phytanoyl-CoA dioxygenase [Silicimonas algicola]PWK55451.1 ectoine hydroxylase-related dioxygenase (phytanoyl-CoA dioxygenase family) [Silicimonas algicola]